MAEWRDAGDRKRVVEAPDGLDACIRHIPITPDELLRFMGVE